jgi:hypothetical protein
MSTFTAQPASRGKLKEMHQQQMEHWKDTNTYLRELKLQRDVDTFTRRIVLLNRQGITEISSHFYNHDDTYVSDVIARIRQRFPTSTIAIDDSISVSRIIQSLFNYTLVNVTCAM